MMAYSSTEECSATDAVIQVRVLLSQRKLTYSLMVRAVSLYAKGYWFESN